MEKHHWGLAAHSISKGSKCYQKMGNWSWNQEPKIKGTMAVFKQCDSGLIFRWSDSLVSHDNEAFGANSPEILHVSYLLCLFFSSLLFSLKTFSLACELWTLFLFSQEKSHFTAPLEPWVHSAQCQLGWMQLLPCFLEFLWCLPFVLETGPGCQIIPLLLCCGLLSPSRLLSTWLAPLLAFMTHHYAFCPCSLSLIALSWLPKCWWSMRGGTGHSVPFSPWVDLSDPSHLYGWPKSLFPFLSPLLSLVRHFQPQLIKSTWSCHRVSILPCVLHVGQWTPHGGFCLVPMSSCIGPEIPFPLFFFFFFF